MARLVKGFCNNGHSISGKNLLWLSGGTKRGYSKTCRKCYNAMRHSRLKLRYARDPEYREKRKVKSQTYKAKKRVELAAQVHSDL